MGTFSEPIQIADLQGRRWEGIDALVDTGATYLTVPRPLLQALDVPALERWPFSLGNGRTVDYEVGVVSLRLDGRTLPVLCVFGDPDSQALLGAVALETFRLAVDPVARRLIRVPGLLM